MRTIGIVYKWKEPFLGSAFWKEYRLSLDETGWIVWSKVTGEVKGVARLRIVFPRIRCQQLDPDDPRVANAVVRIAPFSLVIPLKLQYGSGAIEEIEFAVRTLDDLQTWMTKFAATLGASQQFEQIETLQRQNFMVPRERFGAYPRSNVFVYHNRYNYAPDYYPTLWSSFQTCGYDYGHCFGNGPIASFDDDINWNYTGPTTFSAGDTFSYGGGHGTDPGDGAFSYGGDPKKRRHGTDIGDGAFCYGGDHPGSTNRGSRSHGGDSPTDGCAFSFGVDDHGGSQEENGGGSFSYGGDTGGDSFSHSGDTGGGDGGGFSYGGDAGGGFSSAGDTGGGDSGFSYGGDSGGFDSGGGGDPGGGDAGGGDSGGGGGGGDSGGGGGGGGGGGDSGGGTTTE